MTSQITNCHRFNDSILPSPDEYMYCSWSGQSTKVSPFKGSVVWLQGRVKKNNKQNKKSKWEQMKQSVCGVL